MIHNAIKYSRQGDIVDVKLGLREKAGAGKELYITVKDQGQGIAADDQERIFDLFVRADGLIESGSGLGLHYARRLARAHNGDVVLVQSEENKGATFEVVFPYQ